MTTSLVITVYNRSEVLKAFLEALLYQLTYQNLVVDNIIIVNDASTEVTVSPLLESFVIKSQLRGKILRLVNHLENKGTSFSINEGLDIAFTQFKSDYTIIMDSDIRVDAFAAHTVEKGLNWTYSMVQCIANHPEIGLLAPDRPGSYLRLHRLGGYDEVEWAVSQAYCVSRRAYLETVASDGYWYDPSLCSSQDPDLCYRLRMLGYRIALRTGVSVVDIGGGVIQTSDRITRSNWLFNKKWNERFVGKFVYKSPNCLKWEDWPLNLQFRRLINAQQDTLTVQPTHGKLCNHTSERVEYLSCIDTHPKSMDLVRFIENDVWVQENQDFEDVRTDLAIYGVFDMDVDLAGFSVKEQEAP